MENFLTPLTIRLVFRICVLFIIGSIVPIPDRLWNQAFVDIPLRISPKRSHEAPLYRPCMTNFITRPLPIANYVISTQWGRITSQFPLLSRVKQSITQPLTPIVCVACTTTIMNTACLSERSCNSNCVREVSTPL